MTLAETAVQALEPFVGATVADTCVRATAISLGKTSETLGREDMPKVAESIRRLLGPIAPKATVETLIEQIERAAQ